MRIDKWLKLSRLIKRRTVAQMACDQGRVFINNRPAKAAHELHSGDIVHIELGSRAVTVEVKEIPLRPPTLQESDSLYEIKEDLRRSDDLEDDA